MPQHFVAMSGDHGYLPDHCGIYPDLNGAVSDLASLFELGRDRRRELKRTLSLELKSSRDGAEYCEIVECNCNDISHNPFVDQYE